jgi:uncharacterized protein YceK
MKTIIKLAVVSIALIIALSGCSGWSIMSNEVSEPNSIKKSYKNSTEAEERSINVVDGQTYDVSFNIVTDSGKISISLEKTGDNSFYNGTDIPTSNFEVTLDEPGEYALKIGTDNHSGSFEISWKANGGN